MEIVTEKIVLPQGANVICGQAHFIKTIGDLFETLAEASPQIKFGVAFCESSGKRLVRSEGNDDGLRKAAEEHALRIACGHFFIVFLREAFPVNVLNRIKSVSEVCTIFCATANLAEIMIAKTPSGRGVLGVIDGETPLGVESESDKNERRELLKKFGYKK